MGKFTHGAIGALVVHGLLLCGTLAGWYGRKAYDAHSRHVAPEPEEAERRKLIEEQQAFSHLQNYTVERAYGMAGGEG